MSRHECRGVTSHRSATLFKLTSGLTCAASIGRDARIATETARGKQDKKSPAKRRPRKDYPKLAFDRTGSGPPMILLHGLGSNRRVWDPIVPALSRHFKVVAIDLPGFGESPMPDDGDVSIEAQARAVEKTMERLRIKRAHFVGNSMGGRLALELARRRKAFSVVAISPHGAFNESEGRREIIAIRAQRIAARMIAPLGSLPFRTRYGRRAALGLVSAKPDLVPPEVAAEATASFARCPGFDSAYRSITSEPASGLNKITCPVLILWGTNDKLLSPAQGRRMAARIKTAKLRKLERLGHVPMSEDPGLISEIILRFTRNVAGV